MRVVCDQQGTAEWLQCRVGRVTGSEVWRALAYLKRASKDKQAGESSAQRDSYKAEIVAEILTGQLVEHYVSPYMDAGREREPIARAEYEFLTGCEVETTGFVLHPTLDHFGASPDGLVGEDGCVEFKCPSLVVHLDYLRAGVIPENYALQMQAEMLCCHREWCDFMSFHPSPLPRKYQVFKKRVMRDAEMIDRIEEGVVQFYEEVVESIRALDANSEEHPLRQQLRRSIEAIDGCTMDEAADAIEAISERVGGMCP